MPLYIVGAGGVGRETLDAALAAGVDVTAFCDDRLAGETVRGLPVIDPYGAHRGGQFLLGIATADTRRRLAMLLEKRGLQPYPLLMHPTAAVAPKTHFGPGGIVLGGAYVSSSVSVGDHVQVHYNATIGHDSVLGDYTSVYPGANVAGAVQLAPGATVGSNACVLQGLRVGAGAFIGAGAVVTRDVANGVVVAGVPARVLSAQERASRSGSHGLSSP